ncbi:MAG TPA: HDIG domain-containing protein [Chthoniobacterales bacterium]|jgi:putative nucleotidyltransferase with HDIG domain|nr:HDIG domain-containing protein [Chthoniobacterales bacterium]
MLDFLKRRRLLRRGLASKKQRRRRTRSELLGVLESARYVKVLILAAFIAGLAFLIFSGQQSQPTKNFVIALLFFATAVVQLWINQPRTFSVNSRVFLVFGTIFIQLAAIKGILVLSSEHAFKFLTPEMGWLLAPYAFAPLVLSVLLGRNHGLYAAVFVSLWSSVLFGRIDAPLLVISLISGFTAVYLTLQVRNRGRLIRAGLGVGVATWLSSLTFGMIGPISLFPPMDNDWGMIGLQSALALGSGIVTAMIVGGALPMLEHVFQITTDVSWLELSDLNHPLLRRMTIEAPGTYHHSLVVANLAEAAGEAIGANATLCRVCSYFHDVGKLVKPQYFTENMSFERNPHDDLAPSMSALIIISHVKEGVDLALKHKLNQCIIDIIQEHHGTSLVYYFYQRALQQQEDARAGGKIMNIREEDIPDVEEESFRYQGPKPQTKESAIVSLADIVESASRSLGKPTPQKIEQLVNELIEERVADGQLDECDLTLGELRVIAERFRFTLMTMLHTRIAYPKGESKFTPTEDERLKMRPDVMASLRKPESAPPVSAA